MRRRYDDLRTQLLRLLERFFGTRPRLRVGVAKQHHVFTKAVGNRRNFAEGFVWQAKIAMLASASQNLFAGPRRGAL